MTGQELLDYLRASVLRDVATPYLWSDDEILLALSEAEAQFARRTYALLDSTHTITTAVGVAEYAVPPGTLKVLSAAINGHAKDLLDYTRRFIPSNLATSTGTPSIFINDESMNSIRLYAVPDAVLTINLRIARLPSQAITLYSSPEIPAEYHLDLVEFVAAKLQSNDDADGGNLRSAARHQAEWERRVAEAKREYYRFRTNMNASVARSYTYQRNR